MPRSPQTSLIEHVRGSADGDDGAFEAVYRGLYGTVRDVALKAVRDPAQADEVAQEVLLEIWLKADRYDPSRGGVVAWASAIARHLAVDRVRSERAAAVRGALFAARSAPVDHDEVVEIVGQRLEHEEVRAGLASLSDAQREAVSAVYFAGLSVPEAAAACGVPAATIKSRLRAARAALRTVLADI